MTNTIFPGNSSLEDYSNKEIEMMAKACADAVDAIDIKDLKDLFLFDFQNIIIKHNLVEDYFGDDSWLSLKFEILKNLFKKIEEAKELMCSRQFKSK